jgi:hypothetical protein
MNEIEQGYAGLTSAFNTKFESVEDVEKTIQLIDDKKNEICDVLRDKKELVIKDQTFLEQELKTLVLGSKTILAKLDAEIKMGQKASYFDSYSRLVTAITAQLKELRELGVDLANLELEKQKKDINKDKSRTTILLDANALDLLIKNAKANSQLNAVDATFTIEDEER